MQHLKNKKVMADNQQPKRVIILFDEDVLTDDAKHALAALSDQLQSDGVVMEIGQDPKEHRYP